MNGWHHTSATKRRLAEAAKGHRRTRGEKNPMYGKHHSDETRQKISDSLRGRYVGPNNPRYGKHLSHETRRKIAEAHIGIHRGSRNPMFGKPAPHGSGIGEGSYCAKGHWVRSSWERAWADFYYNMGEEYEYELRSFDLGEWKGEVLRYRPDFYLPCLDLWIEVKGYMDERSHEQIRRFRSLGYSLIVVGKLRKL